ncbi:MAG: beta-lactamase family protein [Chloroflexi bacterium]|nr:beta-lactamase family protein [Chloroflexota bacterium]
MTKPIVATIILQLMEEGRLNLDDPAAMILNDIDYVQFDQIHMADGQSYADQITVDNLLQHRSGLADFFLDAPTRFNLSVLTHPQRQFPTQRIMETYYRYNMHEAAHFAPGEGYYYSDTNYVLLGLIIERLTGQSLPEAIRERILIPTNMSETRFEYYEDQPISAPQLDSYLGPINMTRYINLSYEWGGGGLVSTTHDTAAYIKALFAGEYFESDQTLELMVDNSANAAEGRSYARGLYHYDIHGLTFYGHGGFYGSLLIHNPTRGVTLSAHIAQASPPYSAQTLIDAVVEIVLSD